MGFHLTLGLAEGRIRRPLLKMLLTMAAPQTVEDVHRFEVDVTGVGVLGVVGQAKTVEGLFVPEVGRPLTTLSTGGRIRLALHMWRPRAFPSRALRGNSPHAAGTG